jgi:glycerol uptake facilitator-like aquaporin
VLRLSGSDLARRALAEAVGTAFLLAAVIGSGIMATDLTDDIALQLLINSVATAAALVALILALGSVSGAHFNPLVTLADRAFRGVDTRTAVVYVAAQLVGAVVGVIVANLMFGLAAVEVSSEVRTGGGIWLGEVVATLGLLLVVFGVVRSGRLATVPFAVGGYIGAAYFFTSSTSFANPAVTAARSLSDSFAGIDWSSVPMFITMQLVGLVIALVVIKVLFPSIGEVAGEVIVPSTPDPGNGHRPVAVDQEEARP